MPKTSRWEFAYASNPPWDTGKPPRELVELVEKGLIKPCGSIDLGCDRGHVVSYLLSKGFDVRGIDILASAIRQAIKISKSRGFATNFINADVLSHIPEEKFSPATDIGFYHTLPKKERKHLAKHAYGQYLRRSGTLLLWRMSDEEPDYGGPHPISKDELLSSLKGMGNNGNLKDPLRLTWTQGFVHAR